MMSSLALVALLSLPHMSLPSVPLPHLGPPADVHHGHQRIGAWTLGVDRARFTGEVSCSLTGHGLRFERQAVVLRLSPSADTSNAVYRIDGGAAVQSREDAMELARLGFQLYADDLANPSGGVVRIPARTVAAARQVSVQAKPGAPVATFRIDGLASALTIAHAAGCADAAFR